MFGRKSNMCVTNMSIFQPLEILDRGKNEMNRALGHLCAHIG